jgi:hypothetical protein
MREKNGMSMEDYEMIYKMYDLKGIWPEFFKNKVLYRETMLSRALSKSKMVFTKFLHRFEEAFTTGSFNHIA